MMNSVVRIERQRMLESVKNKIVELEGIGAKNIRVVQAKRYIQFDAIKVNDKWYDVVTTPMADSKIDVTYRNETSEHPIWMDENGRAMNDDCY